MKKIRRSLLSLFLSAVLLTALLPAVSAASTLTISSADELQELAKNVNDGDNYSGVTVTLAADISLNGRIVDQNGALKDGTYSAWTPIGTPSHPFSGTFNGGGHTVTGLYIKDSTLDFQGLFGCVSSATVNNVTVKDSYISAGNHAGAISGYAVNNSVISSCRSDNTNVIAVNHAGGIVGWTNYGDVYNCSANGFCKGDRCVGGIVGAVYSHGSIYNCYSAATVEGKELTGGIAGGTTVADIQNCLMVGSVQSGGYLISGGDGSRTETNCFALKNSSVNTDLTIGTDSQYDQTFSDSAAKLSGYTGMSGKSFASALSALNAWVAGQNGDIVYSSWTQTSMYPYLRDGLSSAIETSYGSEVSKWSSAEMEEAYKDGLIPESLAGEDLTRKINRLEFAAVCLTVYEKLSGASAEPAADDSFKDCKDGDVLKAYGLGITNGTGDGNFSPYELLSREQAATMLTRTYKRVSMSGWTLETDAQFKLDYTMPAVFADDSKISAYARDSVYFMAAKQIITGIGNNLFAPKNDTESETAEGYANVTREQALAMALRMKQKLGS